MIFSFLLASGLVFTQADADLSYRTAKTLVEEHTPRDAGTIRGRLASNCILDAVAKIEICAKAIFCVCSIDCVL